jgi:hypothetical protein
MESMKVMKMVNADAGYCTTKNTKDTKGRWRIGAG